jgi:hypothetical protein
MPGLSPLLVQVTISQRRCFPSFASLISNRQAGDADKAGCLCPYSRSLGYSGRSGETGHSVRASRHGYRRYSHFALHLALTGFQYIKFPISTSSKVTRAIERNAFGYQTLAKLFAKQTWDEVQKALESSKQIFEQVCRVLVS